MDGSKSVLSGPKIEEKNHVYKLSGLEQSRSIEDHCETMEEFSEEDIYGGVNYDVEAKQAGLQENGCNVVAQCRSMGIMEGNGNNSRRSVNILKKESCHEENNGRRMRYHSSAPVNIPNGSQMVWKLKKIENFGSHGTVADKSDDDEMDFERIPPHELIARQLGQSEITSFSVYEGVGRTLKGRDLSQLRNAIWTKTGFLE
jgi:hypothetical protein